MRDVRDIYQEIAEQRAELKVITTIAHAQSF